MCSNNISSQSSFIFLLVFLAIAPSAFSDNRWTTADDRPIVVYDAGELLPNGGFLPSRVGISSSEHTRGARRHYPSQIGVNYDDRFNPGINRDVTAEGIRRETYPFLRRAGNRAGPVSLTSSERQYVPVRPLPLAPRWDNRRLDPHHHGVAVGRNELYDVPLQRREFQNRRILRPEIQLRDPIYWSRRIPYGRDGRSKEVLQNRPLETESQVSVPRNGERVFLDRGIGYNGRGGGPYRVIGTQESLRHENPVFLGGARYLPQPEGLRKDEPSGRAYRAQEEVLVTPENDFTRGNVFRNVEQGGRIGHNARGRETEVGEVKVATGYVAKT